MDMDFTNLIHVNLYSTDYQWGISLPDENLRQVGASAGKKIMVTPNFPDFCKKEFAGNAALLIFLNIKTIYFHLSMEKERFLKQSSWISYFEAFENHKNKSVFSKKMKESPLIWKKDTYEGTLSDTYMWKTDILKNGRIWMFLKEKADHFSRQFLGYLYVSYFANFVGFVPSKVS